MDAIKTAMGFTIGMTAIATATESRTGETEPPRIPGQSRTAILKSRERGMWILVTTFAALVLGESLLVGLAAAGLCRCLKWAPAARLVFLSFLAVFALLETFYLPAVRVLDLRLEIRNPEFAQLIGPGSPIDLVEFLRPTAQDPLWWLFQSGIAFVAYRFAMRPSE